MHLLAIDPGTTESGVVEIFNGGIVKAYIHANDDLVDWLRSCEIELVIEMVSSYGMPVGRETFETVVWIGRFMEAAFIKPVHRLYRRDVKQHFCHSAKAKDPHIWQALIDRYGGSKEAAVGRKRAPGPLFGVTSHCRAALAVGLAWSDGVRSPELEQKHG